MLRSSRAFLGGGGFLGLWAAPGDICRDISLLVKAASSFIPKYYCFQKSERYRRPRRGSRREAGPHHGHHGSSRCSRLHRDKRKREVGLNFWQCVCVVCAHVCGLVASRPPWWAHRPSFASNVQAASRTLLEQTGLVVLPCGSWGTPPHNEEHQWVRSTGDGDEEEEEVGRYCTSTDDARTTHKQNKEKQKPSTHTQNLRKRWWHNDGKLAHNKSRQTGRNKSPNLTSLLLGQVIIFPFDLFFLRFFCFCCAQCRESRGRFVSILQPNCQTIWKIHNIT